MSYSAYVICECYKKGKTIAPPHKEFLCFDEEGLYLDIPDYLREKDEDAYYKMYADFDEWEETACEHKKMKLADEYLSNISGMWSFRHIVNKLGGKTKFPILTKYLPTANDGVLPSEFAQQALKEIISLEKEKLIEEKILLREKSTQSLKASVNSDTYLLFGYTAHNKNNYGIDKDGFFIMENVKEKGKELSYIMFRSNNFIQRVISKDYYKFIDIESNTSFECSAKLYPIDEEATIDYEFEVRTEKVEIVNEYEYIIEPLKRLANASIVAGNPIHWT